MSRKDSSLGSIFKRENVWYLDIRVKGRRIRKRVGTSKKIAELALQDAQVKIAREEFGFNKTDITVVSLIEKFLEYNRTNHRTSTTKRYKAVTDHLRRYLEEKRKDIIMASQLSPEVIEGYKSFRLSEWVNPNGKQVVTDNSRKGARARTVNLELDGIKTMLNLAIRWGYLDENPVKKVKPLKTNDKKPVRFLSLDECEKLITFSPPYYRDILLTFLNSGMRKGELENLQWGDIDLNKGLIFIQEKPDWKPKTKEHVIPLNNELIRLFSRLKSNKARKKDYVFDIKNSGRSHNWLRTELIKIAQLAGVNDLTKIHTLRHTFASHLVMSGVDLPSVAELLGHSDIETTMIYAHLAPEHLAGAVDKLSFGKG